MTYCVQKIKMYTNVAVMFMFMFFNTLYGIVCHSLRQCDKKQLSCIWKYDVFIFFLREHLANSTDCFFGKTIFWHGKVAKRREIY